MSLSFQDLLGILVSFRPIHFSIFFRCKRHARRGNLREQNKRVILCVKYEISCHTRFCEERYHDPNQLVRLPPFFIFFLFFDLTDFFRLKVGKSSSVFCFFLQWNCNFISIQQFLHILSYSEFLWSCRTFQTPLEITQQKKKNEGQFFCHIFSFFRMQFRILSSL